jgi:hypothetical protein
MSTETILARHRAGQMHAQSVDIETSRTHFNAHARSRAVSTAESLS